MGHQKKTKKHNATKKITIASLNLRLYMKYKHTCIQIGQANTQTIKEQTGGMLPNKFLKSAIAYMMASIGGLCTSIEIAMHAAQ